VIWRAPPGRYDRRPKVLRCGEGEWFSKTLPRTTDEDDGVRDAAARVNHRDGSEHGHGGAGERLDLRCWPIAPFVEPLVDSRCRSETYPQDELLWRYFRDTGEVPGQNGALRKY